MKKFVKVLMIVLDILIVGAALVGLCFVAKWVGGHNILDVGEVFGGM
jgi:hypothetical protein